MTARFQDPRPQLPLAAPGFGVAHELGLPADQIRTIKAGIGVPTGIEPRGSIYLRIDSTDFAALIYFTTGAGVWGAVPALTAAALLALPGALTVGGTLQVTGVATFLDSIVGNVIAERTAAAGVTVDGMLIKDGGATLADGETYIVDTAAPTKRARIDAGAITAGQTRVAAMPDRDVDLGQVQDAGTVASARLAMPQQPTTGDTIAIGADTYQFRAAAESVTNDAYIAVEIGGSAALTRANLIAAINATDLNNQHGTIFLIDGTTPAIANGTVAVVADEVDTTFVRIRSATAAGGTVVAADPSIVLAESITHASDVWDIGNVNLNTVGGRATGDRRFSTVKLTITTAMIANDCRIDFPFTPVGFSFTAFSAAGVQLAAAGDSFTIVGDSILVALVGTGAPALVNTDVVYLTAWGA